MGSKAPVAIARKTTVQIQLKLPKGFETDEDTVCSVNASVLAMLVLQEGGSASRGRRYMCYVVIAPVAAMLVLQQSLIPTSSTTYREVRRFRVNGQPRERKEETRSDSSGIRTCKRPLCFKRV